MDAEPLFLPLAKQLNGRASMTFLRHFDQCPRSAYLSQMHKGESSSTAMNRGRALHTILERCTRTMIEANERTIPPELAQVIVNEVLATEHVPMDEHDYIRESVFRWCSEWRLDSPPLAVESLIALRLGAYTVRCRVDFASKLGAGHFYVADYKSARGMPAQEDVARRRADGTLAAKNFQLVVYALALAFGHEILNDETGEEDTEPLASGAERFTLEFIYPGIEDNAGLMARRTLELDALELQEYRASLAALLERLGRSESYGDWPAIVSDQACNECPAPNACPLHRKVRDNRGTVLTMEQAVRAAEVHDNLDRQLKRLRSEIKGFAKREEVDVLFGANKVWRFDYQEKVEITNRAELLAAAEAGTPVNPTTRVAKLSPFVCKTIEQEDQQ